VPPDLLHERLGDAHGDVVGAVVVAGVLIPQSVAGGFYGYSFRTTK
jgi:hypothetical protein